MNITEILKDSLRYPFSDWKKILILGVLIVIMDMSNLEVYAALVGTNIAVNWLINIIGFVSGLLVIGYLFRIIKSSLDGVAELPKFNSWVGMFINGIKVIILRIVYLIPAILIILVFTIFAMGSFPLILEKIFEIIWSNPLFLGAQGIGNNIVTLYILIIIPILTVAKANMAHNNGELHAAFKFYEIIDKIVNIGWGNLLVWYIVIGLVYGILAVIGLVLVNILSILIPHIVVQVLIPLILVPYLEMYFARSVALLYISGSLGYLKCEKCGGYYELKEGESPEDFEECECGGKLKYYDSFDKCDNGNPNLKLNYERKT